MQHWVLVITLKLEFTMLDFRIVLENFKASRSIIFTFCGLLSFLRLLFIRFALLLFLRLLQFNSLVSLNIGLIVFMTTRMFLLKKCHAVVHYLLRHPLHLLSELFHCLLSPFSLFFNSFFLSFPNLLNHIMFQVVDSRPERSKVCFYLFRIWGKICQKLVKFFSYCTTDGIYDVNFDIF